MRGRTAVVVGGGIGGLCAASVLADHFDGVIVVEQDLVTGESTQRRGIPQARHPHVLLARGLAVLESLFPGLGDELAEQGAMRADFGECVRYRLPAGWAPVGAIGVPVQSVTRVVLERCLRGRVLRDPRITTRAGFAVEGLTWSADRGAVTGVIGPGGEVIAADVVVETSGRTTKLPQWLRDGGYGAPEVITVAGDVVYTTRVFSPKSTADWRTVTEFTNAPADRRGGIVVTTEEGQHLLTMVGAGGESAPTDPTGFLEYAKTLRSPQFAEAVSTSEPVGPAYRMGRLNNRWTLYHRMSRWPDGLLCLGDAVCTLNPAYAQGMTVTAIQARVLRDLLERDTEDLAGVFRKRVARALAVPWAMATATDLNWDRARTPVRAKVAKWYLDRISRIAPGDRDVFRRFSATIHLVRSPVVLLAPSVLWKVLRTVGRGDESGAVVDQAGA